MRVASTADRAGISTIVYLINDIYDGSNLYGSLVYAYELPIKKITMPAENLSNRLYIPNTNAPVFALVPTTSDIKLMPVESTIV